MSRPQKQRSGKKIDDSQSLLARFTSFGRSDATEVKKPQQSMQKLDKKNAKLKRKKLQELPFDQDNIHKIKLDLREVTENVLEGDYKRYLADFTQDELDRAVKSLKTKEMPLTPRELSQERARQRLKDYKQHNRKVKETRRDLGTEQLQLAFQHFLDEKGYHKGLPDNMEKIIDDVDTTRKMVDLRRKLDDLEQREKKYIEQSKVFETESEVVYVPEVLNEEEVRSHGAIPIHGSLIPKLITKPKSPVSEDRLRVFEDEREKRPVAEPELDEDQKYYNSLDKWGKRGYHAFKHMPDPPEKFDFDDPRGWEKFFLPKRINDDGVEVYGDEERYFFPEMQGERLFNAIYANIPKGERMLMQYNESTPPLTKQEKERQRVAEDGPNQEDIYKWAKRDQLILPLYSIHAVREHNDRLVKMLDENNLSPSARMKALEMFYQQEPELPQDVMIFFKVLEPDLFNINPFKSTTYLQVRTIQDLIDGNFNTDADKQEIEKEVDSIIKREGLHLPSLYEDDRQKRIAQIREDAVNRHREKRIKLRESLDVDAEHSIYDDVTVISPRTAEYYRNTIGEANLNLIRQTLLEEIEDNPDFFKDLHHQMLQQHYRDMQRSLHGGIDPFNIPERLANFRTRQAKIEADILEHRQTKLKRARIKHSQTIFNMKFTPQPKRHETVFASALSDIFDDDFALSLVGKTKEKRKHTPKQHLKESTFFKKFLKTSQELYKGRVGPIPPRRAPPVATELTTRSPDVPSPTQTSTQDSVSGDEDFKLPTHKEVLDRLDLTASQQKLGIDPETDRFLHRLRQGYIDINDSERLNAWEQKLIDHMTTQNLLKIAQYSKDTDIDILRRYADTIPGTEARKKMHAYVDSIEKGNLHELPPRTLPYNPDDKRHPEDIFFEETKKMEKKLQDIKEREETKNLTPAQRSRYKATRQLRDTNVDMIQKRQREHEERKRKSSWVVEGNQWVDRTNEVQYQENLMKRFKERNEQMRRDHDRFREELKREDAEMTPDQKKAEMELQRMLFPKLFEPKKTLVRYPAKAIDGNTGKEYDTLKGIPRVTMDFYPLETRQKAEHPRFKPLTHDYLKDIIANRLHQNKVEEARNELKFIANELFMLEIELYNQIVEDNNNYLDLLQKQQDERIAAIRKMEEDQARGIDFIPVETFDPVKQAYQQMDEFERARQQLFKQHELKEKPKEKSTDDPSVRPLPVSDPGPIIDYTQFKLPLLKDEYEIQELRDQLISRIDAGEIDLTQYHRNSNYNALVYQPLREKEMEINQQIEREQELALLPKQQADKIRKMIEHKEKHRLDSMIKKHAPKLSPVVYSVLKSMHDANIFEQRHDMVEEIRKIREAAVKSMQATVPPKSTALSSIKQPQHPADAVGDLPGVTSQQRDLLIKHRQAVTSAALTNPALLNSFLSSPPTQMYIDALHKTLEDVQRHHLNEAVLKTRQYRAFQEKQIKEAKLAQEQQEYDELMRLYYEGEENPQRVVYDYIDNTLKMNPASKLLQSQPTTDPAQPWDVTRFTTLGDKAKGDRDGVPDAAVKTKAQQEEEELMRTTDAFTRFVMNFTNISQLLWSRSQRPEAIEARKQKEAQADAQARLFYLDQTYFPKTDHEKQRLLSDIARDSPHLFTLANPLVLDEICNNSGVFNHLARKELRQLKESLLDVPIDLDKQLMEGSPHLHFDKMRDYQVRLWERRDKLLQSTSSILLPPFLQYRLEHLRTIHGVPDPSQLARETSKDTLFLHSEEYQKRYHPDEYKQQQRAFRLYDHFYSSFSRDYKSIISARNAHKHRQASMVDDVRPPRSTDSSLTTLLSQSVIGTTFSRALHLSRRLLNLPDPSSPSLAIADPDTVHRLRHPITNVFHNRRSPFHQLQSLRQMEDMLRATTHVFSKNAYGMPATQQGKPRKVKRYRAERVSPTEWFNHYQQQLQTRIKASAFKFTHILPYLMSKSQPSTTFSSAILPRSILELLSPPTSTTHTEPESELRQKEQAQAEKDRHTVIRLAEDAARDLTPSRGETSQVSTDALIALDRQAHPFHNRLVNNPILDVSLFSSRNIPTTTSISTQATFLRHHTMSSPSHHQQSEQQQPPSRRPSRRPGRPSTLSLSSSNSILDVSFNYKSTLEQKNAVIHNIRFFSSSVFPPSSGQPPQQPPRRPPPPPTEGHIPSPMDGEEKGDGDGEEKKGDDIDDDTEDSRYSQKTREDNNQRFFDHARILNDFYRHRTHMRKIRYKQRKQFEDASKEERNSDFYYKSSGVRRMESIERRQGHYNRHMFYRIQNSDRKSHGEASYRAGRNPFWRLFFLNALRSSIKSKFINITSHTYWFKALERLKRRMRETNRMNRFLTKGRRQRKRKPYRPQPNLLSDDDDGTNGRYKYHRDLKNGMSMTLAAKRRHQRLLRLQDKRDNEKRERINRHITKRNAIPSTIKEMIKKRDEDHIKMAEFREMAHRQFRRYPMMIDKNWHAKQLEPYFSRVARMR